MHDAFDAVGQVAGSPVLQACIRQPHHRGDELVQHQLAVGVKLLIPRRQLLHARHCLGGHCGQFLHRQAVALIGSQKYQVGVRHGHLTASGYLSLLRESHELGGSHGVGAGVLVPHSLDAHCLGCRRAVLPERVFDPDEKTLDHIFHLGLHLFVSRLALQQHVAQLEAHLFPHRCKLHLARVRERIYTYTRAFHVVHYWLLRWNLDALICLLGTLFGFVKGPVISHLQYRLAEVVLERLIARLTDAVQVVACVVKVLAVRGGQGPLGYTYGRPLDAVVPLAAAVYVP
mmetsp:Transcript_10016/g.24625  ORF Transcript_10016/g.24625 Transcript_10016/m.24625 type:complete len:287 (+) Transcript_10016:5080-5940(+)